MLEAIKEAALRFVNLIINPDEEWNVVASEKPTLPDLLFPYTTMGFILFFIASMAGYFLRSSRTTMVVELAFSVAIYLLPLAIFIATTTFLAGSMKAIRKDLAYSICLYSFSPAWVLSLLYIIPVISFGWLWIIISIIFTSILFIKASSSILGIPPKKKPLFVVVCLASLALPMFAGFLMKYLWLVSKEIL